MECAKLDCEAVQEYENNQCTLLESCSNITYTAETDVNIYFRRMSGGFVHWLINFLKVKKNCL